MALNIKPLYIIATGVGVLAWFVLSKKGHVLIAGGASQENVGNPTFCTCKRFTRFQDGTQTEELRPLAECRSDFTDAEYASCSGASTPGQPVDPYGPTYYDAWG